jgi:hypothetical protein
MPLRKTDPRFTAQMEFKHLPNDPLVQTVWNIYEAGHPVAISWQNQNRLTSMQ